mmetsp:Transcript_118006/g.296708  ORF Transcript_118006/g.296708 Transcript_118006/m.296708 type:complete len:244 (-) Transcript_118006:908-1639(-)
MPLPTESLEVTNLWRQLKPPLVLDLSELTAAATLPWRGGGGLSRLEIEVTAPNLALALALAAAILEAYLARAIPFNAETCSSASLSTTSGTSTWGSLWAAATCTNGRATSVLSGPGDVFGCHTTLGVFDPVVASMVPRVPCRRYAPTDSAATCLRLAGGVELESLICLLTATSFPGGADMGGFGLSGPVSPAAATLGDAAFGAAAFKSAAFGGTNFRGSTFEGAVFGGAALGGVVGAARQPSS